LFEKRFCFTIFGFGIVPEALFKDNVAPQNSGRFGSSKVGVVSASLSMIF
jgi:hypothetical protein